MKKWYYAKLKFNSRYDGRKIWYLNNYYMCDCINLPFETREECEEAVEEFKNERKAMIEFYKVEISIHWTR